MSRTFKYTITRKHCFVDNEPVLMYFVENMPFAFDVLEREQKEDKWRELFCGAWWVRVLALKLPYYFYTSLFFQKQALCVICQ